MANVVVITTWLLFVTIGGANNRAAFTAEFPSYDNCIRVLEQIKDAWRDDGYVKGICTPMTGVDQ